MEIPIILVQNKGNICYNTYIIGRYEYVKR